MMNILSKLGIRTNNFGACSGPGKWHKTTGEGEIASMNPATGETIASVYPCSAEDYETVVCDSLAAFQEWRKVPAPERGQLVRKMGDALRDNKDALGSLVALEMGKIKQEGDGDDGEMDSPKAKGKKDKDIRPGMHR